MAANPFFASSGRLRNGWWVAIFFIVLFALLFPLMLLARGGEAQVPIWAQAVVVLLASAICQALRRRPLAELVGAFDLRWPLQFALGLAIGAALMLAPALLLWAFGAVRWQMSAEGASALLPSLGLFAAVAITEELMFRGFLFQRLIAGLGPWFAQVLIGALFVLTHADALRGAGAIGFAAMINIFVASVLFGAAFLRTRSLAMPIGLHLAADFVQGGVLGFGVSGNDDPGLLQPALSGPEWLTGGAFGLEASLPGLVTVVLATALLLFWRTEPRPARP
jgi:membrane protease YdiL (CAAX protease family)